MQSSRLIALGQMSAGMAHELNQPLTVLSALAEGVQVRLEQGIEMTPERLSVLHSWCIQADWNAPTIVGGKGAWFWDEDGQKTLLGVADRHPSTCVNATAAPLPYLQPEHILERMREVAHPVPCRTGLGHCPRQRNPPVVPSWRL